MKLIYQILFSFVCLLSMCFIPIGGAREIISQYGVLLMCFIIFLFSFFQQKIIRISRCYLVLMSISLFLYLYSSADLGNEYYKILVCIALFVYCVDNNLLLGIDRNKLCVGIVICVLFECVLGIVQFVKCFVNGHKLIITGTFDNPVGIALTLLLSLPFLLYLYDNHVNKMKTLYGVITITIGVMLILIASRTCILAAVGVVVFHLIKTKQISIRSKGRWTKYVYIFCTIGVLIILYYWKLDSFHGRLLVWKGVLNMITDSPIYGYGIGGFQANYMTYQATLLQNVNQEYWGQLADDVSHPFNEYLKLIIEFGICALIFILFIFYKLWQKILCINENCEILYLEVGIILIVTSFFSYPFRYPLTWCMLGLMVAMLGNRRVYEFHESILKKLFLCGIFLMMNLLICNLLVKYYRWDSILINDEKNKLICEYESLYVFLKQDNRFLYNYAAVLNENEQYAKSIIQLKELLKKTNTYDIQILIANNYDKMYSYELAEKHLKLASNMCPNRFLPLYLLVGIYDRMGNKEKAIQLANQILSKKIKINSNSVKQIKREMNEYLNE